jgi:N4-(beta-N-acetylglucosaminyl)-L-asparaginase
MAPVSRRRFLGTGAAAAAGLSLGRTPSAATPPITQVRRATRPAVIASANGLRGVARAYEMLARNTDPLDAAIAGVNIQELDPEDQSVGLGGLPNADGVVQLDASCMHGPTRRAGAVASLEGIATPSLVAKAVMDYTDHILLVGPGAKQFALQMGFKEQNLLTEKSRQDWLRWKARLNANDAWLDHDDDVAIKFSTGTINMNAVTASGDIASVTTTSGLAWKIPGRVGDSPIIGAGQYCDNTVGAAGSTGRGEANIKVCGAFLTVEGMRRGLAPQQACLETVQRVVAMTERRLLDDRGRPRFDLNFYAIAKDGSYGAASIYSGGRFAVADAKGARLEDSAFLFKREERPRR